MLCAPAASSCRMCGRQPGPYDGVERLEVVLGHGEGDVHAVERGEHAPDRFGLGRDEVGRHGEDGFVEPAEDRGEPGERRARHLVGDDDDPVRQVVRRLLRASHRQAEHGEDAAEKREVALQQRLAVEAQLALVAAHAPRLAAGEQDADAHPFQVCRLRAHREEGV